MRCSMPGTLRPNEPSLPSGSSTWSGSIECGPSDSVIPSEVALLAGSLTRRWVGRRSSKLPPLIDERSRPAKVGCSTRALAVWGQPITWVARRCSIRSRVAPGSKRSSNSTVAPACMALTSV